MSEPGATDVGKKVFFLYPHSVLHDGLIDIIVKQEYEVYLLKDHELATRAVSHFPNSILFINLDEGLSEPEWEAYIRDCMQSEGTRDVRIGILSYNEDNDLAEKYLMDIMVPCGFIRLKLGIVESAKILLKTLEANEARGRRKYVRISCGNSDKATFNIKLADKYHCGSVIDISSAGMACVFEDAVDIKVGANIADIQLRLKGALCRGSGRLAGINQSEKPRYVIMFDDDMEAATLQKIHSFVHAALQDELQRILRGG